MKLYLLRHGIAVDHIGGAIRSDFDRNLTDEGRAETKIVAKGLQRLGVNPDLIITSPLVRAKQTGEVVGEVFGDDVPQVLCDALAPGGTASDLYKFLRTRSPFEETFLVGHEPDMGRLAGTLLWSGPEFDMHFKKAGACRIDIFDLPPTQPGTLKWFLTPKILSHVAN